MREVNVFPLGEEAANDVTDASREQATLRRKSVVTPDNVHRIAKPVLAHRWVFKAEARFGGVIHESVLEDNLNKTHAPTDSG